MSVKNGSRERKKTETVFLYQDAEGNDAFEVVRIPPKQFRVRYKDESGKYVWKAPAKNYPYRLPSLLNAPRDEVIYVTEGEKDADTLRSLGLTATTMRGGTGNTKLWAPWGVTFQGRIVCILPDNDDPGRLHAARVAEYLRPHAAVVLLLLLPGLPPKGDVTDWLKIEGNTPERFKDLVVDRLESSAWGNEQREWAEPVAHQAGDAYEPPQLEPHDDDDQGDGWEPMPLDVLPPIIARYVEEGARALPCDPAQIAMHSLVACAGAIGNSRIMHVKESWPEPCILWDCVIVAPSSRKTASFRIATDPLGVIDAEWAADAKELRDAYDDELAAWEAKSKRGRNGDGDGESARRPKPPTPRKIIVGDITVETVVRELVRSPRGLALLRDELSGWFGGMGRYSAQGASSAEVSCWTEAYEGKAYRYDRSTGDGTSVVVPRCSVSISGNIQPELIQRCLTRPLFDSGLAYRFMLIHPPEVSGEWRDDVISTVVKADFHALIRALVDLDRHAVNLPGWVPRAVTWDADGFAVWKPWHDRMERMIGQSQGDRKKLLAKGKAWAARLALVLHLCDYVAGVDVPPYVTADQATRATRLAEWAVRETERVYAMIHSDAADLDRQRLVDWLVKHPGPITARQLRDTNKAAYPKTERAKLALDQLATAGLGQWLDRPTGVKGGRPTAVFSLYLSKPQNPRTP